MGASDNRMHRLEQLQATFDEGPCMDAVHSGRFVGEPDPVRVRERWPVFGPAAVAAEIQETFSFPVTVDKITFGALDRACGITAVRLGVTVERSLQLLRDHARQHGLSLDEVATRIIDGPSRSTRDRGEVYVRLIDSPLHRR